MYDISCPMCDGECYPLGPLGDLWWFRCRDCGIDSNTDLGHDEDERVNVSAGATTLADW